ncbi:MAG: PQQ-like beta-propeller repeat protein [Verrucomicrobiae bacterium]|nr:PQQ-like beta-propeller repeat protein [Verrucomicrobiae bacterium]
MCIGTVFGSDYPQWRGPNRNGTSSETGLLPEWPEGGPKLRWQITNLGSGYGAPAVVGQRLFIVANEGPENEFVAALSTTDGKRLWQARLGNVGNPKQDPNFPGARSTPTVEDELLWALGSDGDLACVETATGNVRWRRNLRSDFAGKPGTWAYSESPLVDGDLVVCTPGGAEATIVALNKKTGETVWKCALPDAGDAAYASAIVIEVGGIRQYVQLLQKGLFGVDARTGKLLWKYTRPTSRFDANIPTPLFGDGCIYVASAGTGGGAIRLLPRNGEIQVEELYFGPRYPTAIGGVIKVGNFLYGTTDQALVCLEFTTGQTKWQERVVGAASMCLADNRLYLHGENGDMALVEPSPDSCRVKGKFTPPGQPPKKNAMEKAWAYPVVAGGALYIRDHNVLWCYELRKKTD